MIATHKKFRPFKFRIYYLYEERQMKINLELPSGKSFSDTIVDKFFGIHSIDDWSAAAIAIKEQVNLLLPIPRSNATVPVAKAG